MALQSLRLRRALCSLTTLNRSFPIITPVVPISPLVPLQTANHRSPPFSFLQSRNFLTARDLHTEAGKNYSEEYEITEEDRILILSCDFCHWLITVNFPDPKPNPEEMVAVYEQICAKGLNISIEDAKQRMYACSTTTYHGFQAVMTQKESEKFRDLPEVVFVLPDTPIDPANKEEYGGDKYDNGVITPRPPLGQGERSRAKNRGHVSGMSSEYREGYNHGYNIGYSSRTNPVPPYHQGQEGNVGETKYWAGYDMTKEDRILLESCDYNHWLILVTFPHPKPTPEEMVAMYEQICSKGLNISVEEAKHRIYACSTTTYHGFQAAMTEKQSWMFRDLPEVAFVLPDAPIDPSKKNKEYRGDKYENGVITPRPPPGLGERGHVPRKNYEYRNGYYDGYHHGYLDAHSKISPVPSYHHYNQAPQRDHSYFNEGQQGNVGSYNRGQQENRHPQHQRDTEQGDLGADGSSQGQPWGDNKDHMADQPGSLAQADNVECRQGSWNGALGAYLNQTVKGQHGTWPLPEP